MGLSISWTDFILSNIINRFTTSYIRNRGKPFDFSSRVNWCGGITDYQTFMNDFRKSAELVRWLKEKTEGWDSQPFGSVFASTSDTPISSVVTADFLYLTKANPCVRSHFDKHRVNHLDSHPDLSAMSSTGHKVKHSTVIELLERGRWDSPDCYSMPPLCSIMGKRKDIIGVMSNLMGTVEPLWLVLQRYEHFWNPQYTAKNFPHNRINCKSRLFCLFRIIGTKHAERGITCKSMFLSMDKYCFHTHLRRQQTARALVHESAKSCTDACQTCSYELRPKSWTQSQMQWEKRVIL